MNNLDYKIYVFGDSISFGQHISPAENWVTNFGSAINKQARMNFIVQNASVNGNTTRMALDRISNEVMSHHPHMVIVQFGMNDCNYWLTDMGLPRVSVGSFRENLIEIIQRCIASGAEKIFLNTNHPSGKVQSFEHVNTSHAENNRRYNSIIREVHKYCQGQGYPVNIIDIEEMILNEIDKKRITVLGEILLDDGIHLSKKGHQLYSLFITDIIKKYLPN